MESFLEMLIPRAKNVLKEHDALFWINDFMWPRNHTHTQKTTFPKFQTHERNGRQHSSNNDPFERNNFTKLHTMRFLLYLPPVSVPNQKQPNPKRTSIPKEKQHERHRTMRKTSRKHEPNRNRRSKQQNPLPQHHPAIDLNTPQHRCLKQVDSLRCVMRRSCPPSENLSLPHRREKLHNRHHSTMTEDTPNYKMTKHTCRRASCKTRTDFQIQPRGRCFTRCTAPTAMKTKREQNTHRTTQKSKRCAKRTRWLTIIRRLSLGPRTHTYKTCTALGHNVHKTRHHPNQTVNTDTV